MYVKVSEMKDNDNTYTIQFCKYWLIFLLLKKQNDVIFQHCSTHLLRICGHDILERDARVQLEHYTRLRWIFSSLTSTIVFIVCAFYDEHSQIQTYWCIIVHMHLIILEGFVKYFLESELHFHSCVQFYICISTWWSRVSKAKYRNII